MFLPVRQRKSVAVLPRRVVSNDALGIDHNKCVRHTGITQRRYASPSEATSDLIAAAFSEVTENERNKISSLVVATTSPDVPSPATAHFVHRQVGLLPGVLCYDVMSSCSSYLSALHAALPPLVAGSSGISAVCSGEVKHKALNPDDVRTKSLFADGACVQLWESVQPPPSQKSGGVGFCYFNTRSDLVERIMIPGGGSRQPKVTDGNQYLKVTDGKGLFSEIVKEMTLAIKVTIEARQHYLQACGYPKNTPGTLYIHQANANILEHVRQKIEPIWPFSVPILMSDIGNAVGSSLPILYTREKFLSILEHRVFERRIDASDSALRGPLLLQALVDEQEVRVHEGAISVTLRYLRDNKNCCFTVIDQSTQKLKESWLSYYFQENNPYYSRLLRYSGLYNKETREAEPTPTLVFDVPSVDMFVAAGGGFQTIGVFCDLNHFHLRK